MKKWIFSLSFTLTFSLSHSFTQNVVEHEHSHAPQVFKLNEAQYVHPDSVPTGYLAVRPMRVDGFSGASARKLNRAFEVLEKVVNSAEFKERVINFKNSKGERKFASNNGLSNQEIYESFMGGLETLQPNTPGEMNFYLRLYHKRWSRVIGYTSPTTNTISVNWKFFRNYEPHEVAGNLAHEWVHKIGFDHRSAAEHDSVPYAIGYMVEEMAAKYLITSPTQKVSLQ